MSSTAVTAIFIPVALRIAQTTRTPTSRLMMPLSFAALISGMTTLVATAPNLVVNAELERHGAKGFHFFSFTPFGVPILILGIIYMIFARRWLVDRNERASEVPHRPTLADWIEEYRLAGREHRVRVKESSPLADKTLADLNLRDSIGANLVAIERGRELIQPTLQTRILAGDILLVDLFDPDADAAALRQRFDLVELPLSSAFFTDRSQEIGMTEVIVPAQSEFLGKTVMEAELRSRYGLTMIGLRRGRTAQEQCLREQRLAIGDTLLLIGSWRAIDRLRFDSQNLVILNLPAERDQLLAAPARRAMHSACWPWSSG
jgi:di/tricarboxylate transporter